MSASEQPALKKSKRATDAANNASTGGAERWLVFHGRIVHSLSLQELQVLDGIYLGVHFAPNASKGVILFLVQDLREAPQSFKDFTAKHGPLPVHELGNRFLMPGLIDTHCHAPQYVFTGCGHGIPLLEWLTTYTFPAEKQFSDLKHAKDVYGKSVARHVRSGTTCCTYFATIHVEATIALFDVVQTIGQRALIGKVCMDQNSPDDYVESAEASASGTVAFADAVAACQKRHFVTPIVTPRFAPTSSSAALAALGKLAAERKMPIQSHISENKEEIAWVKSLFPDCTGYADVYHKHGLLTDRTIMAHCIYMTREERALFKKIGVGVSHCPNSNYTINSGVLNVRTMLDEGLKVGLGTDVAGGYSASILDSLRLAIVASKSVMFAQRGMHTPQDTGVQQPPVEAKETNGSKDQPYKILDYKEAFYLATLGGAEVVGMADQIGNFVVGKEFDALVVNPQADGSPLDVFASDSALDIVQKFLFLGDDRNIEEVYVSGFEIKKNLK